MHLLINTEEMEIIAKHPNWAVLYELSVIICPDDCAVIPMSVEQLELFTQSELEMLFIGLTLDVRDAYPQGREMHLILLDYLNELPENRLDETNVALQASYAIKWGIEGHCSYVAGKKEPSFDEGLWQNPTIDSDLQKEIELTSEVREIKLKPFVQAPYTRRRESSVE